MMHGPINISYSPLLALCYYDMFRPSKNPLEEVGLIYFHSQINKICGCKNVAVILPLKAETCRSNTVSIN